MPSIHNRIPNAPFGCYEKSELEAIRTRVRASASMQQEYERQVSLSEQFLRAEEASSLRELGSFRTDPFVFRTPVAAAYLHIAIHIVGPGTARIRGIQLTHSERGLPVAIAHPYLGQDLTGWHAHLPEGALMQAVPYLSTEAFAQTSGVTPSGAAAEVVKTSCLELTSTGPEPIILTYEQPLAIKCNQYYSVQTALSLLPPSCGAVQVEISFTDEQHQPVDSPMRSPLFQRSTCTNWAYLLEAAGADANRYMMEDDPRHARSSADKLLYMLDDMLQGMEIFRATGWHDDDVYGAVHIGRGLAVLSIIYGQITGADVLEPEEKLRIHEYLGSIAAMMMDTQYYRYDLTEFPDEKGGMRSNWNADRATGLGVYALMFPQEKDAEKYLEHARSVVDWQLEHVVDARGAWPENIRYHGAVLHRYFLFFVLLKRLRGIDYFGNERVQDMYRFLTGSAITFDRSVRVGVDEHSRPRIVTPSVGDANVHEQWWRLMAYAAPQYSEVNPRLAGEMMWAWQHGGRVVRDNGAFPYPLAALLYPQPELQAQAPVLGSDYYPDMGYVIFRDRTDEPDKSHYLIYEASPLTYHAHNDEGHFSIWAESVPLTLDSGTGGYYNGDRHWYLSSSAHNVVQFTDANGVPQDGPLRSTCDTVYFSEELDYVSSTIPDELARSYQRHLVSVKAGWHVYLIWDRIESDHPSVWNLHTLSTHADVKEHAITAYGLEGMCLDALIAQPHNPDITSDVGALGGGYELGIQQHFRIHGQAGEDYIVFLHGRASDNTASALSLAPLNSPALPEGVYMYKLSTEAGQELIYVLNGNNSEQDIDLALEGNYRRLHAYSNQDVTVGTDRKLRIGPNQIHILLKEDVQ